MIKKIIEKIEDMLFQLKTRRDWHDVKEVDDHIDSIIKLVDKLKNGGQYGKRKNTLRKSD